jgi:hypothetical protein
MKDYCLRAIWLLRTYTGREWAEKFVELRMQFHRKHGYGLIQSTWHGTDFFKNVLDALDGKEIEEPKGEYRNNFIKLIELGKKEAA